MGHVATVVVLGGVLNVRVRGNPKTSRPRRVGLAGGSWSRRSRRRLDGGRDLGRKVKWEVTADRGEYAEALPWYQRAVEAAEQGDVHGRVDHASLAVSRQALQRAERAYSAATGNGFRTNAPAGPASATRILRFGAGSSGPAGSPGARSSCSRPGPRAAPFVDAGRLRAPSRAARAAPP